MKNTFDKRVRPRVFKEGDLVLKKRLPNVKDPWGKWAPNYEGPYVVKQAFSGGVVPARSPSGDPPFGPQFVNMQFPRLVRKMHKAKPKFENFAATGETREAQAQIRTTST
ncbi:hypothetical protein CR513_24626, partial [Mucuna pruriens]